MDVSVPLFVKMLSFDRHLKERCGQDIVVGVIYQGNFRKSLDIKNELFIDVATHAPESMGGMQLRFVAVDLSANGDLEKSIAEKGMNVLYLAPVRTFDVCRLTELSRARRWMAWTGVPEYVRLGIAPGFGIKGGKPCVLVHPAGSRAESTGFSSQLPNLATLFGVDEGTLP
jgi:hypothetical protein